ncbi:uncharacterized protein LOC144652214 [Oculina patagonica]
MGSRPDDVSMTSQGRYQKVCVQKKISYIVAPYEAHPQLAFLVSEGYAEFAISEDSDLLIYSCKEVLFKLEMNDKGQVIEFEKTLCHLFATA